MIDINKRDIAKQYWLQISKPALFAFILSLVLVVIKIICLNSIPAPASWFHDAGELAEKVLYAMISSFIFYLLVVVHPNVSKRLQRYPHISRVLIELVDTGLLLTGEISAKTGKKIALDNLREDEIIDALKQIQPSSNVPEVVCKDSLVIDNWIDHLISLSLIARNIESRLHAHQDTLDSDLFDLSMKIFHHNLYSKADPSVKPMLLQTANMGNFKREIYSYLMLCQELRDLMIKKHNIYFNPRLLRVDKFYKIPDVHVQIK